jgi:hypothetical protein
MPRRPPKNWFDRCVEGVRAGGAAVDPQAVCGATWARKSAREKRSTLAAEEGTMATKKKAKKKPHHGGKTKAAHKKPAHKKPHHGGKAAHHGGKHTKAAHHPGKHGKHGKHAVTQHHRCAACGHTAKHDAHAGCLHHDRKGHFCSCKHRV